MKFSPRTDNEAVDGFNYRLDFDYHDIPAGISNNTSKVWAAGYLPAVAISDIVVKTELHLTIPFEDQSDAAFNTSTLSLGDATTATRFINASEANVNGTEVLNVIPGANQNVIYTAAGQLQLTLNSMAAKSLSDLDKGAGYILMAIIRAADKAREKANPFVGGGQT
jgi:hypothetical protein